MKKRSDGYWTIREGYLWQCRGTTPQQIRHVVRDNYRVRDGLPKALINGWITAV